MFRNSVDKLHLEIARLGKDPFLTSPVKERIQMLEMELGFLKMSICFLPTKSLQKSYIRATVRKGKLLAVSRMLRRVEFCRLRIRNDYLYLFDFPSKFKFSNSCELLRFINCTLSNLRSLFLLKPGTIVSVRMQVKALIKKLRVLRDIVKFGKGLFLGFDVQDWVYKIACLSILYWVDEREEEEETMAGRMMAIFSNFLLIVKSYAPKIIGYCLETSRISSFMIHFGVLNSQLSSFNTEIIQAVANFVDFLLPVGFLELELLHKNLLFLLSFLTHSYTTEREMNAKDWDLVVIMAEGVASEVPSLIGSLIDAEMNQEAHQERNLRIKYFHEKIDSVKAEVRNFLYLRNPESWKSCFPVINALGFIDFLLENLGTLKETSLSQTSFLPFAKDQLDTLHKELLLVRPDLENLQDMQNEFVEVKDLWKRITDAAYRAEHAIDSCQIYDVPIWYNLLCLSDAIEEVKLIKGQIKMITDNPVYNNVIINAKLNSGSIHLDQSNTFRLDETVVGFEDEAETIIKRLTRGSTELDIVSIVGMPGQGKTTLARKVYNSDPIRHHFRKYAWCFVTQVYEEKKLLLDIFRGVTTVLDDKIHKMSKEDLEEELRRCLMGQRYLIIMDDIWDIQVLNAVKMSFPNNRNGSRILITSRNELVCNPHRLRSLNDTEAMELLMRKIFPKGSWSSSFSQDAQKVLKVCNGLSLAIVVVAGLLKNVSNDLKQWRQIVQTLNSKVASEGCRDMLELSYKSLPDFLKPCFLYLGAAGRNNVVKVHKLIQLWIAEGFVRKSGVKSQEELGREYLEDLIGRSLVIVNKRSFGSGEVKECRIHDLLLEFCTAKAEEETFIHFAEGRNYSLGTVAYDGYRMCIVDQWIFPSSKDPIGPKVRSILIPPGNSSGPGAYGLTYPYFIRLKYLRVLDLGTVPFYSIFPAGILLLVCLRYLSIRTDMEAIPSSIGNLCNLEFFYVARDRSKGTILQFPCTIWKMKSLRNVNVGLVAIKFSDDHDPNACPQLGNLDSFSSLCLYNMEDAEKLFKRFPRVRKLKLVFTYLWDCNGSCDQFQVQSLSKLESLHLEYYLGLAHTCTFHFPTTLKRLTLSGFGRPWNGISTIGKLPNLEVLKLLDVLIGEETWDVEDEEFLSLKYLKLSGLNISHWEASTSSFPCLERLFVEYCDSLVALPSIFADVLTLETIQIRRCLKSLGTSAEGIRDKQRDMENDDLEVRISEELPDYAFPLSWGKLDEDYTLYVTELIKEVAIERRPTASLVLEHPEFDDKKGGSDRNLACIKKRHVPSSRGTSLILKHNCQPRQAIMFRHNKEELKRDT